MREPFLFETEVKPEWIDYNGHMNVAYYVLAFDHAIDDFYGRLGLGEAYARSGRGSMFALTLKVDYLREVRAGDPLRITTRMLDCDAKRIHYCQEMVQAAAGYVAARKEGLSIHVDLGTRRSAPFPPDRMAAVRACLEAHAALPRPDWVGQRIGIRRRSGGET